MAKARGTGSEDSSKLNLVSETCCKSTVNSLRLANLIGPTEKQHLVDAIEEVTKAAKQSIANLSAEELEIL